MIGEVIVVVVINGVLVVIGSVAEVVTLVVVVEMCVVSICKRYSYWDVVTVEAVVLGVFGSGVTRVAFVVASTAKSK